jgi:hypothetical protein
VRVRVETFAGHGGVMPCRIYFDERCIEVAENLDQWHGPDYRYFKLRGDDGNLYILRLDEARAEWSLTLFQSARAEERPAPPLSRKGSPPASRVRTARHKR